MGWWTTDPGVNDQQGNVDHPCDPKYPGVFGGPIPWVTVDNETGYVVDDSGERELFDSGMVRDTETGKVDLTYVIHGPMLVRWAEHMMKGAVKYDRENWMQATGTAELERFKRSAFRHLVQWLLGETDEDHAAAIIFNVNGAEFVREVMDD